MISLSAPLVERRVQQTARACSGSFLSAKGQQAGIGLDELAITCPGRSRGGISRLRGKLSNSRPRQVVEGGAGCGEDLSPGN